MKNKQNKTKRPKSSYSITSTEMYSLSKKELPDTDFDYKVPRIYHDYYKSKFNKELEERNNNKKVYRPKWPPKEWTKKTIDGEVIEKPKRKTYINEVEDWVNSYNGLPKGGDYLDYKKEIYEKAKEKIDDSIPIKKEYMNQREYYLKTENDRKKQKEELEERKVALNQDKQILIEQIKEKTKENELKKSQYIEQIKKKYDKTHSQLPRCDKISFLEEAIYLGEQTPFYNQNVKNNTNENTLESMNNIPKIEHTSKFPAEPIWSFSDRFFGAGLTTLEKDIKDTNEKKKNFLNERKKNIVDKLASKKGSKNTRDLFNIQVTDAYNLMKDKGKRYFQYNTSFKETELYINKFPKKKMPTSPGPSHYFIQPTETQIYLHKYNKNKDININQQFSKFVDRRKEDKIIYKPRRQCIY